MELVSYRNAFQIETFHLEQKNPEYNFTCTPDQCSNTYKI